jgi:hypothetical protein
MTLERIGALLTLAVAIPTFAAAVPARVWYPHDRTQHHE